LERKARASGLGLWADPAPIPPWDYRKARRRQAIELPKPGTLEAETEKSVR
jgi:endonuclease YncB( thermonuclease family)